MVEKVKKWFCKKCEQWFSEWVVKAERGLCPFCGRILKEGEG